MVKGALSGVCCAVRWAVTALLCNDIAAHRPTRLSLLDDVAKMSPVKVNSTSTEAQTGQRQ